MNNLSNLEKELNDFFNSTKGRHIGHESCQIKSIHVIQNSDGDYFVEIKQLFADNLVYLESATELARNFVNNKNSGLVFVSGDIIDGGLSNSGGRCYRSKIFRIKEVNNSSAKAFL